MKIESIIAISYYVVVFLVGAIPTTIALITSLKKKKKAQTKEEEAVATNDMKDYAMSLIVDAEKLFASVDGVLKQQGESAGPLKKENVLTKLQAYAINKGYRFDNNKWSNTIDEIVKLTKEVNS